MADTYTMAVKNPYAVNMRLNMLKNLYIIDFQSMHDDMLQIALYK